MKTVQLIGTCPLNVKKTPVWDGVCERWCANDPHGYEQIGFKKALGTWTRWFNVHSNAHIRQRHPRFFPWAETQDGGRPIYTLEANPRIPGNRVFPGRELVARFADDFFTHQAAWLVACAMAEGFERIELWGYQFGAGSKASLPSVKHKYAWERPCITHWLARARHAGIEVVTPPEARLYHKEFLYGYEGPAL